MTSIEESSPLTSSGERARLSGALPAVLRLLTVFELSASEQSRLLKIGIQRIHRVAAGQSPPTLTVDQLLRASLLTGICSSLDASYGARAGATWLRQPNARLPFQGASPLTYLQHAGLPGLWATRRLLDSEQSVPAVVTPEAWALAATLPQPDINLEE
ncbi:antitoxin Xre/MbcA/ParS toxin-binding domain-containing protein [Deinococcus arcticus]|uniref:antitoxin Xre/MbcA/ParS toxin-binding domain-containing protein n=1 Tax=Deinococcus arcticus TaxID=2136176 RepID=UPI000D171685|nr:antitoxin Xre/MbcA/ParS toxin-binding domain-containing protein [Deinococcus arcticus]